MKAHLTEEEIQQYALDSSAINAGVIEHISSCESCKEKAEAYRLLFTSMQQQPAASFDFDLTELVMAQLHTPAPRAARENLLVYIFITAAVAVTGFALYFFRGYVAALFKSIAPVFIYLVVTAFITLSIILIADMYKNYKKKMNTLDVYKV